MSKRTRNIKRALLIALAVPALILWFWFCWYLWGLVIKAHL